MAIKVAILDGWALITANNSHKYPRNKHGSNMNQICVLMDRSPSDIQLDSTNLKFVLVI